MRYRELYGFSHPETSAVYLARAGRGLDVYFFGVPPEAKDKVLPLLDKGVAAMKAAA